MSLFRKAGKKIEETKRAFEDGAKPEYVCRGCEEPATQDHDYCPNCGEDAVESVED